MEADRAMIVLPNKYTGEPEAVAHSEILKRSLKLKLEAAERDQRFEKFVRNITKVKE